MRKEKKKLIVVTVVAVLVLTVLGCLDLYVRPKDTKHYAPIFSEEKEITYFEYNKVETFQKGEKLSETNQVRVNDLCNNLCSYLNNKYNACWKSEPIVAYSDSLNYLDNATGVHYEAFFKDDYIVIGDALMKSHDFIQVQYVLSHELLHYLYELNCPNHKWRLEKDGKLCGIYFEEAVVDMLAREFTISMYPEAKENNFKSGYKFIRFYAEELRVAMPNYLDYFFRDDLNGLKTEMNTLAKNYVSGNSEEFFTKFLYILDMTQIKSKKGKYSEIYPFESAELSFLAYITPKERMEEFIAAGETDNIFVDEGFGDVMY